MQRTLSHLQNIPLRETNGNAATQMAASNQLDSNRRTSREREQTRAWRAFAPHSKAGGVHQDCLQPGPCTHPGRTPEVRSGTRPSFPALPCPALVQDAARHFPEGILSPRATALAALGLSREGFPLLRSQSPATSQVALQTSCTLCCTAGCPMGPRAAHSCRVCSPPPLPAPTQSSALPARYCCWPSSKHGRGTRRRREGPPAPRLPP